MLRRTILAAAALTEIRKIKTQIKAKRKALVGMMIPLAHNLKPVKRDLHLPAPTSSAPSTNSTASPDADIASQIPGQSPAQDPRTVIEEISCGIAEAQAALFAGRIEDLESCIARQGELCAALKSWQGKPSVDRRASAELIATAHRVRHQNLVFGATVRRMRRHLDSLRNLLNGLSLTYQPKPVKVPDRES
jgi:hypothetical protein